MVKKSPHVSEKEETGARERILNAAFSAFMKHGYSDASTLDIATRAKVSKRELYTLFGSKHDMLVECIGHRAKRFRAPDDLPPVENKETLRRLLEAFGVHMLTELSDPAVIGVFRLAIAEAERAPEVARALETFGRGGVRATLTAVLGQAQRAGIIDGDPREASERFWALLWGNLFIDLLLRFAEPPDRKEATRRARTAVAALLKMYGTGAA